MASMSTNFQSKEVLGNITLGVIKSLGRCYFTSIIIIIYLTYCMFLQSINFKINMANTGYFHVAELRAGNDEINDADWIGLWHSGKQT